MRILSVCNETETGCRLAIACAAVIILTATDFELTQHSTATESYSDWLPDRLCHKSVSATQLPDSLMPFAL